MLAIVRRAAKIRTFTLVIPFLLADAGEAWARAGGARSRPGGGGHGGDLGLYLNLLQIAVTLCILAGSVYLFLEIRARSAGAKALIARYAAADPSWDLGHLKSVVKDTFFLVQEAWMQQDQESCRHRVTDKLHEDHEDKIRRLKRCGSS